MYVANCLTNGIFVSLGSTFLQFFYLIVVNSFLLCNYSSVKDPQHHVTSTFFFTVCHNMAILTNYDISYIAKF